MSLINEDGVICEKIKKFTVVDNIIEVGEDYEDKIKSRAGTSGTDEGI